MLVSISSVQASVVWDCNGGNIEYLQIVQDGNGFTGAISWSYSAGGAIDSEIYYVHQVQQNKKDINLTIYLSGSSIVNSKFNLTIIKKVESSTSGDYIAHLFAKTPESPFPIDEEVSCVKTIDSIVSTNYNRDCADPNSDEGIRAWESGKCGPVAGGSN